MWRQANLKAIIDHQPPWLVWLQCARCNWLGRGIRSFNRKYTLSLSISVEKWQQREEAQFPEATVSNKNWIDCRRPSNATIKPKDFALSCTFLKSHSISSCLCLSLLSTLLFPEINLKRRTRRALLVKDRTEKKKAKAIEYQRPLALCVTLCLNHSRQPRTTQLKDAHRRRRRRRGRRRDGWRWQGGGQQEVYTRPH